MVYERVKYYLNRERKVCEGNFVGNKNRDYAAGIKMPYISLLTKFIT
jgi:hypothetical protein